MTELRTVIADLVTAITGSEGFIGLLNSASEGLRTFRTGFEEFNLNEFWEKYNPFNEEGRQSIYDSFRSFWHGESATQLRNTISGFFEYLVEEIMLAINRTTGLFSGTTADIQLQRIEQIPEELRTPEQQETLSQAEAEMRYRDQMSNIDRFAVSAAEMGLKVLDSAANTTNWMLGLNNVLERANTAETFRNWTRSETGLRFLTFGRSREQEEIPNVETNEPATRRIGTLRATGMRSEPRDTVAQIHQGERVLNPQETQEYNNQSGDNQRDMLQKLDQLNNTMMTVASLINQELSIQTRTMNSISGLGPDLMKGMPG
jgi:hypothetical protein